MAQPDLIHRIWLGGEMPARYEQYGKKWEELNPDHHLLDWGAEAIEEHGPWQNQAILDHLAHRDQGRGSIEYYVQVADVLSYELVRRFGGVYMNVDVEPIQPLSVMDEMYGTEGKAWVVQEDERFVVGNAMGAPKNHPFFIAVVDRLAQSYGDNPFGPMNVVTGPHHLTRTLYQFEGREVVVLPVEAFNPIHWRHVPPGHYINWQYGLPAGTIGIHHWGHRLDGRTNVIESGTIRE